MADMKKKITEDLLEKVYAILTTDDCISFGITKAHDNLLAGRILATGAEQLYMLLKRVEHFAGTYWNIDTRELEIGSMKETAII
jgi:hypothetical protein